MRRSLLLWLSILLCFTLVAAACGDDGDSAGGDDSGDDGDNGSGDDGDDDSTDGAGDDLETGEGTFDGEQITSEGEGSGSADLDPVYGGDLRWGLNRDGTGFDLTGAVAPGTLRILSAIADPLVRLDADGNWAPFLAESFVPNDDYTVWTVTMRDGVVFHDGSPLDAETVVANLQAFKDSALVGFVVGQVESYVVTGDLTFEARMTDPWATFPFVLTGQAGFVVPTDQIGVNDWYTGTGPFKLDSWTLGEGARLVRNDDYWQEGLPYLDSIEFTFAPEQDTRRLAFEQGQFDGYLSPGDADILDFLEDDSIDVWIGTGSANEMAYLLNVTVPPLDDVRVRRALAHATPRQDVIDLYRSGLSTPANGPIHPGSQWYVETDYPDYDLDEARRLIEEYEAEVGPVEFTMSSEQGASFREVTDLVLDDWRSVGVDVEYVDIALGQSAITGITDNFEAIAWIQFSDSDPDGFYIWFHSSQVTTNWSNHNFPEIDEPLARGRATADLEERKAAYADFQHALADLVPVVWLDHFNGLEGEVAWPYVHGVMESYLPDGTDALPMTGGSFHRWEQIWMEPQG
ncbi:MAG: ABC transporter substrate-binding protein [Acidimicrobiales bacterium]|nr:ABC transporter substrate-binding protein [Acidimicrobiales bacterium]